MRAPGGGAPEVVVAASAMTPFGRAVESDLLDLAVSAGDEALRASGIPVESIGAVYLGAFLAQSLHGQGVLASVVARRLGIGPVPTTVVEGACASGGIALRHGIAACRTGEVEAVLCIGVEHMTSVPTRVVTRGLAEAFEVGSDRELGLTFPGFFGLVASNHFDRFGTTREQLAAVTVKNRGHAEGNACAMFREPVGKDDVLASRPIAEPLHLLDCSPIADGAAAAVVASPEAAAGAARPPVRVLACEQASGATSVSQAGDLTTFEATTTAAWRAFEAAGVGPDEIDVVELHDCFSIAEIVDCEDLGLLPRGEAATAIEDGATTFGGAGPVVNPSGGLLSRGHPVGATALAQIHELVLQLQGAANREVDGARLALAHNLGGTGATATVSILAV